MEGFRAALIVVGVTRTHFDYDSNYLPVPEDDCQRVLGGLVKIIPEFRSQELPVIFVRAGHRINSLTGETMPLTSPFWRYQMENKINVGGYVRRPVNTENSSAVEIMPQLGTEGRDVIVHKQRCSTFMGTPPEVYLRVMGINALLFAGANANNHVLCTAFEAYNRDYRVIATENCYASMDGKTYHELAMTQIRVSLGWVVNSDPVADTLDGRTKL